MINGKQLGLVSDLSAAQDLVKTTTSYPANYENVTVSHAVYILNPPWMKRIWKAS
jgi:hypothetical protein